MQNLPFWVWRHSIKSAVYRHTTNSAAAVQNIKTSKGRGEYSLVARTLDRGPSLRSSGFESFSAIGAWGMVQEKKE